MQLRNALGIAQREEFAKSCKAFRKAEEHVNTPEGFLHLCRRTYGSVICAWRQALLGLWTLCGYVMSKVGAQCLYAARGAVFGAIQGRTTIVLGSRCRTS